jgi:hypothetical protein
MLTLRASGVLTCKATQNAGAIAVRTAPVGQQPVDADTKIAAAQVLTGSFKA